MLGRIFGKKNNSLTLSKEQPGLSGAVSRSILRTVGSHSIPAMPAAAHRAFQLAIDPNAETRDFIGVIQADEALAARVLKIANSVFYDRGQRSTTIEEAVLVIGINELRGLLNANTLGEIFPCKHPARTQLWANDIGTAMISRSLAQRLLPNKEALAFLGGLMHDIGKLLLLQRSTEEYLAVLRRVEEQACDFCQAEEQSFPFDHTEVGQLIGERWKFNSELSYIIRNHHRTPEDGREISLPFLIHAADIIAHALGLGHPRTFSKFRNIMESQLSGLWGQLRIPAAEQKNFLGQIKRNFDLEYDLYTGNIGSA